MKPPARPTDGRKQEAAPLFLLLIRAFVTRNMDGCKHLLMGADRSGPHARREPHKEGERS
ncbi:MAG: hypothetical protein D6740_13340 [Alphaproteobacteria bacterium]|nr:MAG: hypothetical protein D6740_13340 [Alphaproteobacteria bacterium]